MQIRLASTDDNQLTWTTHCFFTHNVFMLSELTPGVLNGVLRR